MYEELFKYGHWEKDEGIDTFYGISLNRDIGDYKAGKFFDYAIIDPKKGELELGFYRIGLLKPSAVYSLSYNVGNKIRAW